MRRCNRQWIAIGTLIIILAACQPTTEDETVPDTTTVAPLTPLATAVTQLATVTPSPRPDDVVPPPIKPTPQPTSSLAGSWQLVGGETVGLALRIPPGWTDLSPALDVAAATNPLGLSVLLLSDSQRTGRSVLAGKDLTSGAYGVGLIAGQVTAADDPVAALNRVISDLETAVIPLGQTQPITATTTSGVVNGAVIEIDGDPLGFFEKGQGQLRARLLLFLSKTGGVSDDYAASLFLFSAPVAVWGQYSDIFDQMARTIVLYDSPADQTLSAGHANVRGALPDGRELDGQLEEGVKDVWTFSVDEAVYATLSLAPEGPALDLTLTLISPTGQTVTRVDSGYAGDTEIAADIFLTESGRYVVEISDFFNQAGHYMLSLAIDEEPRSTGAGKIRPGQGIESTLPTGARHVWTFNGTVGHLVSIVLTPKDNQMDAILNLYGPDGQRLVALDEGFSGDAEVISGFELPVTGLYSIVVSSFAGNGGVYNLALDEGGEATQNFYDAGDLVYGQMKSETLRSGEAHAWFFQGAADDAVRIIVRPLNDLLDLDVWLFDPDVQRLAAQDKFAAGETEVIEFKLPIPGQYLVLVREFFGEAGSYEIDLSATAVAAPLFAGQLRYDEPVTGTLIPGQAASWQFSGDQDDVIDVELTPAQALSDLVLVLRDPEGGPVLELDEAPAGQSEKLDDFTITADGQWHIVVKDFFDEGGDYSLAVSRSR